MTSGRRWDPCIYHQGKQAEAFFRDYFSDPSRRVLLVAGAGFDPRSPQVCEMFAEAAQGRVDGLFLREERPMPVRELFSRADANQEQMLRAIPGANVRSFDVFSGDNAVIGGRAAVALVSEIPASITDVVIDVSALSVGVAFPLIRHLFELVGASNDGRNLHVVVVDDPTTDGAIRGVPCDRVSPVHGFRGRWGHHSLSGSAILWMPQLSHGKQPILQRIHQVLCEAQPDTVVCPILPFPSSNPRLPDELIEEYADELQSGWAVDARDLIFAGEKSPLDLYRTILRIDDARSRVFENVGGSQIVLSPLGSKALSLGALMAALERGFTIMHVESIGYTTNPERLGSPGDETGGLVHIWLHGDAYRSREDKDQVR